MTSMKNTSTKTNSTTKRLAEEFTKNNWLERLARSTEVRVDQNFEYSPEARHYLRQRLVKYYEGDVLIAFVIYYDLHDGKVIPAPQMLLIGGVRTCVSS
jgi:hypothetical protein